MIRRPPRSTQSRSSAASDVYKRQGLFSAAPSGSRSHEDSFTLPGHPFSLSYGIILPSSLTRVRSIALVFSTHLPVSVLVRAPTPLARGFSRKHGVGHFT